jgi:hypothetical protein
MNEDFEFFLDALNPLVFLSLIPRLHSCQPKSGIINTEIREVSPPFEGGVAGTIDI